MIGSSPQQHRRRPTFKALLTLVSGLAILFGGRIDAQDRANRQESGATLDAVLSSGGRSAAQDGDQRFGVGMVSSMLRPGGDAVDEDFFRYLGQSKYVDEIYNPLDAEDFFRILSRIKARGKRINFLIIAGHGSYDAPGVKFIRDDMLARHVDYCRIKKELYYKQLRLNELTADSPKRPKTEAEFRELEDQLRVRDAAMGVMAPGGVVVVLSCSAAGNLLGQNALRHLGQILLAEGGGTIAGSAIDNIVGQYSSRLNQIQTRLLYGSWDEIYSYFVHGKFLTFQIADGDGEIVCPGPGSVEADNMLQILEVFERRARELRESALEIARRAEALLQERGEKIKNLAFAVDGFELHAEECGRLVREHASLCQRIETKRKTASAYCVAAIDGEKAANLELDAARALADSCRNSSHADAIESGYQSAKKIVARMSKDLDTAVAEIVEGQGLVGGKDDASKWINGNCIDPSVRTRRSTEITSMIVECGTLLERLSAIALEINALRSQARSLREEIEESARYYTPRYRASKERFAALVKETDLSDIFKAPITAADISFLVQSDRSYLSGEAERLERLKKQMAALVHSTCSGLENVDRILKEAQASVSAALLRLAADEDLLQKAAACRQRASSGSAQTRSAVPVAPHDAGGLRIIGKARLVSGEISRYIATDGLGTPYTDGVSWTSTVEDVLVIDEKGNAAGFKTGRAVIVAQRGSSRAFFEVTVVPRGQTEESDQTGGGASGSASSGTRDGPDSDRASSATDAADCGRLRSRFDAAIGAGDLSWAGSVLTQARACGFHAQAAAALEETRRTRAESERLERDQACERLRQRFQAAANGQDLSECERVLGLAGECSFLAEAGQWLQQARHSAWCDDLGQQFGIAVQNEDLKQSQAILGQGEVQGCNVPQSAYDLAEELRRNLQQRDQQRTENIGRMLEAFMGMIQSRSSNRNRRAPAPAPSSTPPPSRAPSGGGSPPPTPSKTPEKTPAAPPNKSPQDCVRFYCPMCDTSLIILGKVAEPSPECRQCMERNRAKIDQCQGR